MPKQDARHASGQRPEADPPSGEIEREGRSIRRAAQEIARETADHRHQRADRKVEPGGENGHSLRHRDQRESEHLVAVLNEHR